MFIIEIDKIETGGKIKHNKTSWEVSLTPGFEDSNIIFKSLEDEVNLTRISVPLPLNDDDLYYIRTKVYFSDGSESDWSRPSIITKYSTGFNFNSTIVVTPQLSVDFDIRSAPLGGFLIKSSEFKLFSGVGNHKATTWIIEDDKGNQIWGKVNDEFNLTSIRVPYNILTPGKLYTIKAMYLTDTNIYSNYGRLRIICNPDLINDQGYLAKLKMYGFNIEDNKDQINYLMSIIAKSNLCVGVLENKLKNITEEKERLEKENEILREGKK